MFNKRAIMPRPATRKHCGRAHDATRRKGSVAFLAVLALFTGAIRDLGRDVVTERSGPSTCRGADGGATSAIRSDRGTDNWAQFGLKPVAAQQMGIHGTDESIEEFFHLWEQFVDHVPSHLTICQFGMPRFHEMLSWNLMERLKPPKYNVYLHFFKLEEKQPEFDALENAYPNKVFRNDGDITEDWDGYCSMILVSLHYPWVNFEEIRVLSQKIDSIFLGYFRIDCGAAMMECRWMSQTWNAALGDSSYCGEHGVCMGMIPSQEVFDDVLSTHPAVECPEFMDPVERPHSWTTQWQQDWFVYHNFFADNPGNKTYVDVGAYHPFKYSNTLFFEKCLGWKGVCVEPNPYNGPLFRAYRKCELVQNCVWSKEKTVVMGFEKDMIEAEVPTDEQGDVIDVTRITGQKKKHEFDAVCLTLEAILEKQNLRKIDYMSVDAEHAEVEIFRVFPFEKYDITVFVIEVQPDNFYKLDAIFLNNGYGKVGILGGDHVYMKLGNFATKLNLPAFHQENQEKSGDDFHSFKKPKIDYD